MSLSRLCLTLVFVSASSAVLTNPCAAQWRGVGQPIQKTLRVLGQGYGPGYHWRTPGHDSSYYNPYTADNSFLVSESGYYDSSFNASEYQLNGSVPHSVYAPNGNDYPNLMDDSVQPNGVGNEPRSVIENLPSPHQYPIPSRRNDEETSVHHQGNFSSASFGPTRANTQQSRDSEQSWENLELSNGW